LRHRDTSSAREISAFLENKYDLRNTARL